MEDGPSQQPAIVGTLERARSLRDQVADLVATAAVIANRVSGPLPPTPKENLVDGKVYSDSLTDAFLSIHDATEFELNELKNALSRIASQV